VRCLIMLLTLSFCGAASAQYAWPEPIVSIEEMKMLTRMTISVPRSRPKGEVRGPSVLRVHVDKEGLVRHVALHESSGSSAHDEAAMLAMRGARFSPKHVDGIPADVSLIVPLHFPIAKHQRAP
jgi:TonB family protein